MTDTGFALLVGHLTRRHPPAWRTMHYSPRPSPPPGLAHHALLTPAVATPRPGVAVRFVVVGSFRTETIAFDSADTSPVVREMESLADRGDGLGWINIGPGLRDDQIDSLPTPSPLGRWFSGRGPAVPMATWTPPRGVPAESPPAVGVEHGVGPKALDRLRDAGAPLPAGWRKVQDHAKHGIVAHPPPSASHADVLRWLLDVCWALCPIDIEDHWLAEVHRPG